MGAVLSTVSTWVKSLAGKILGTMSSKDTVIAVAGVGDLGKFICEELQKAPGLKPIVLTRNVSFDVKWQPYGTHLSDIASLSQWQPK